MDEGEGRLVYREMDVKRDAESGTVDIRERLAGMPCVDINELMFYILPENISFPTSS